MWTSKTRFSFHKVVSLLRALYLQRPIRLGIHLLWGASGKPSHFIYLVAQNILINSASNSKGLSSSELTILTETMIAVGFSISLSAHFCFIPPPTHLPTSGVLIPRAVLKRMLLNKFLLTIGFQGNKSPTLPPTPKPALFQRTHHHNCLSRQAFIPSVDDKQRSSPLGSFSWQVLSLCLFRFSLSIMKIFPVNISLPLLLIQNR